MEKIFYLNDLFDLYGDLLTDKQQKYFKDYYFDNLSYGEISEKYNISRNAIFHQLKIIEEKLEIYEKKLNLLEKKKQIDDIINMIDDERIKNALKDIF